MAQSTPSRNLSVPQMRVTAPPLSRAAPSVNARPTLGQWTWTSGWSSPPRPVLTWAGVRSSGSKSQSDVAPLDVGDWDPSALASAA